MSALAISGFAQSAPAKSSGKNPKPAPTPKGQAKMITADQVIETTIFFYGGRAALNQIRKTTLERGTLSITAGDGRVEQANYQKFIIRAETLPKEKIRLDQEFPTARYALVFNDGKVFGIFNNTVFTPREDASRGFENQIIHGLDALLRYKENESKVELAPREKLMGVDYFVVNVTDKLDRRTRFYISAKSFRVMMLTYEDGGVKFKRRFYDYNPAQSTLVAFRTVLWADEKVVEETEVGTITFGQKVDEALFSSG